MQEKMANPHTTNLRELALTLMRPGSDWQVGIGSLIREVEAIEPGFIQKIAAIDQLRRLGLPVQDVR